MIYFYKPGCFYCNEFEPIWNKFTNKNKHIRMRKINGDTHPSMIDKFNAGASLVQIYTGWIYEGPGLIKKMNKIMVNELSKN